MADIELVIKIPEELISEIDDENYQSKISWFDTTLYCAIKNGTPLPKGHGRLIDGDALKDRMKIGYKIVENAPTIIEADKSESEEKNICSTCANANNVVVCPYTIKDIAAEEGCKFWHEAESEG